MSASSPDSDGLLQILVDLADKEGHTISLTLNVSGAVIAGELIGMKEWAHLLREDVEEADDPGFIPAIQSVVSNALNEVPEGIQSAYIHLRDVHYLAGRDILPTVGPGYLWRGRLSEVTGWAFGSLEPA